MGQIVAIMGGPGEGKTTSTIVNPDGTCIFADPDFKMEDFKEKYKGMNPRSHVIINLDQKDLTLPPFMWKHSTGDPEKDKGKLINEFKLKTFKSIEARIKAIAADPNIKSVSLDTLNLYLLNLEVNDRKMLTFDKWKEISNDIYLLNMLCINILRDDQIAYIMGHTMQLDVLDDTIRAMSVIGKKMTKTSPEAFYNTILMTEIEYGDDGNNKFWFTTRANHSTSRSPIGMFKDFKIPASLKLVDDAVRKYYGIPVQ